MNTKVLCVFWLSDVLVWFILINCNVLDTNCSAAIDCNWIAILCFKTEAMYPALSCKEHPCKRGRKNHINFLRLHALSKSYNTNYGLHKNTTLKFEQITFCFQAYVAGHKTKILISHIISLIQLMTAAVSVLYLNVLYKNNPWMRLRRMRGIWGVKSTGLFARLESSLVPAGFLTAWFLQKLWFMKPLY